MRAFEKMVGLTLAASLVNGCNGPVLQNAPRPNPAVVAGAVAATAAAITLADLDGAAKRAAAVEQASRQRDQDATRVGNRESAPADVLDRLDDAERRAKAAPRSATTREPKAARIADPVPAAPAPTIQPTP
jgi:hypothetical protein